MPSITVAHFHRLTQHCHCDFEKPQGTTRLKGCACAEKKGTWRSPKCCTWNEKSRSSLKAFQRITLVTQQLSTFYQIHWNVKKCHACLAKRQYHLFGNLTQRKKFFSFLAGAAMPHQSKKMRRVRGSKASISNETSSNGHISSLSKNQCFPTSFKFCTRQLSIL